MTAALAVSVLAACALAWRRHHWHVQREKAARVMARVSIVINASTQELDAAFRRLGDAISGSWPRPPTIRVPRPPVGTLPETSGSLIASGYRTPEQHRETTRRPRPDGRQHRGSADEVTDVLVGALDAGRELARAIAEAVGQRRVRHDPERTLDQWREHDRWYDGPSRPLSDLRRAAPTITGPVDTQTRDEDPDRCWRCDASPADDARLGLCPPCHTDLRR